MTGQYDAMPTAGYLQDGPPVSLLTRTVTLRHPDLPAGSPPTADYVVDVTGMAPNDIRLLGNHIFNLSKYCGVREPLDELAAEGELVYRFTNLQNLKDFAFRIREHYELEPCITLPTEEDAAHFWCSRNSELSYVPSTVCAANTTKSGASLPVGMRIR